MTDERTEALLNPDRLIMSREEWQARGMLRPELYPGMPTDVGEALCRYVTDGAPLGSFLKAVVSNDLMDAFARADLSNREAMFDICQFVYNEIPSIAMKSREAYWNWIEMHRKARESPGR